MLAHVGELRDEPLPAGVGLGLRLERGALLAQGGQRSQPAGHVGEPLAGSVRLRHLLFQLRDPRLGGRGLVVGDTNFGLEPQGGVAELLEALGPGPQLGEAALDAGPHLRRGAFRRRRGGPPLARTALTLLQLDRIAQAGADCIEPGAEHGALLLEPLLRDPQAVVAQHPREELGPLRRGHRRHDGELFLAGEVGIEELIAGHPEQAGDPLGHRAETVGDRRALAILVELSSVERADQAVVVGPQAEVHLHFDPVARGGPAAADRIAAAPGRGHAVHRPRDRLEDRGLPRAVGPDDPGEAHTELQLGVLVLPEVAEVQPVDLHQAPAQSRSTESISSPPSRTNASRSRSAGSGRPVR